MTQEQKQAYIKELCIRLKYFGFQTTNQEDGVLSVAKYDKHLCEISDTGGIRFHPDSLTKAEEEIVRGTVKAEAATTLEYMRLMAQVPDEENRFVSVKGGAYADLFVVRIANGCVGKPLVKENGLLRTTKENAMQHGIGLESIRRTLQRYQGVLTFHPEGDMFVLKFSFPLRQESL